MKRTNTEKAADVVLVLIVGFLAALLCFGCGADGCPCGGSRCVCRNAAGGCITIRQPDGKPRCFGGSIDRP